MKRAPGGFTLVEVLVAMVLIGLTAAATASGFQATTNLLGENTMHAQAVTVAQAAIEDVRNLPFDEIQSGVTSTADGTFVVQTQVNNGTPEPGMKHIVVTASWEWKGEPRSYVLQTIYSRVTKD